MGNMKRVLSLLLALCLLLSDVAMPVLATEAAETIPETVWQEAAGEGQEGSEPEESKAETTTAPEDGGEPESSEPETESQPVGNEKPGTSDAPLGLLGWTWNDARTEASILVELAAGENWFQVVGIENARDMVLSEGTWEEGTDEAIFLIVSETERQLEITLSWPEGSQNNPIVLTDDDFAKTDDPYVWEYLPEAAAWFAVTVDERMLVKADGVVVEDRSRFEAADRIEISWPVGSKGNPIVLTEEDFAETDDPYIWEYLPEAAAWFTVTVEEGMLVRADGAVVNNPRFEAADRIEISWPTGSKGNPIALTLSDFAVVTENLAWEYLVDGETWFSLTVEEGMQVMADGMKAESLALFCAAVSIEVTWPTGSKANPIVLAENDFTATDDPYVWKYLPESAAWFTVTVEEGMLIQADGAVVEDCGLFKAAEEIAISWPVGTKGNPIALTLVDFNVVAPNLVWEYSVNGETWFTVTVEAGMRVEADGKTVEDPGLFAAENEIEISWPVGSKGNPIALTKTDFVATSDPLVWEHRLDKAAWFAVTVDEGMLVTADGKVVEDHSLFHAADRIEISWPVGSQGNPIVLTLDAFSVVTPDLAWEYPVSGKTWFSLTVEDGMQVIVDGGKQDSLALFCAVNKIEVTWPVGSKGNPIALTEDDFAATDDPYVWAYLPEAAAWFTVMVEEGMRVQADGAVVEDCSLFQAADKIEISWPVGSKGNPIALTKKDFAATGDPYVWERQLDKAAWFAVTVDEGMVVRADGVVVEDPSLFEAADKIEIIWPTGSKGNPIVLTQNDFAATDDPYVWAYLPEAAAWFTVTVEEGMLVKADGVVAEDPSLFQAADKIEISWPVGSKGNPIALTEDDFAATDDPYAWAYLPEAAAWFTVTVEEGMRVQADGAVVENPSLFEAADKIEIIWPTGSKGNPIVLTLEEFTQVGDSAIYVFAVKDQVKTWFALDVDAVMLAAADGKTIEDRSLFAAEDKIEISWPVGHQNNPFVITKAEMTVQVPARTAYHCVISEEVPFLEDMVVEADGEVLPVDGRNFVLDNSDGEEERAVLVEVHYPSGHVNNPVLIENWGALEEEVGWSATITVPAGKCWNYKVSMEGKIPSGMVVQVGTEELEEGVLTFSVDNREGAENREYTVQIRYPLGNENKPVLFAHFTEEPENSGVYVFAVPAGKIFSFRLSEETVGMLLTIGDQEPEFVTQPRAFKVESGTSGCRVTLRRDPAGSENAPADLVMGTNKAVFYQGAEAYYFTWTADSAGKLHITMPSEPTIIWNCRIGDAQTPGADQILVEEGDQLTLVLKAPEAFTGTVEFGAQFLALAHKELFVAAGYTIELDITGFTCMPAADDAPVTLREKEGKLLISGKPGCVGKSTVLTLRTTASEQADVEYIVHVTVPAAKVDMLVDINGKPTSIKGKSGKLIIQGIPWTIDVKVYPEAACSRVIWSSSNDEYATVDNEGNVMPLTTGAGKKVTITATAVDGSGMYASTTIRLEQAVMQVVPASGYDPEAGLRVAAGKSLNLASWVSAMPVEAANKKLKWYIVSGEELVAKTADASISSSGVLAAGMNSAGKTIVVRAVAADGYRTDAFYDLKITSVAPATAVEILDAPDAFKMSSSGTRTFELKARVLPYDEAEANEAKNAAQKVTWSSSNVKYATVDRDSGLVTVQDAGAGKTVTITATTTDGTNKKASVKIRLVQPVEKITIAAPGGVKSVAAGKSLKLTAVLTPANVPNKQVVWTLVDESGKDLGLKIQNVASLSKTGVLKADKKAAGETVIVCAKPVDGLAETVVAMYPVTIKAPAESVTIQGAKPEFVMLSDGDQTLQLSVLVSPFAEENIGVNDAKNADQSVTWKSSSDKFATVDQNGLVTFLPAGAGKTVTITATANDGTNKKATVKIKLVKPVESITLDESLKLPVVLAKGKSLNLTNLVSVTANATNKKLNWALYAADENHRPIMDQEIRVEANVTNGTLKAPKITEVTKAVIVVTPQDGCTRQNADGEQIPVCEPLMIPVTLYPEAVTKITIWYGNMNVTGKSGTMKGSEWIVDVQVEPGTENAYREVQVTSSDETYAKAEVLGTEESGKIRMRITGYKAGIGKTVTITVAAQDGSGKKATTKIRFTEGIDPQETLE